MIRGTTPTLNFKFPKNMDISRIRNVNIIFFQNGDPVLVKESEEDEGYELIKTIADCIKDIHNKSLKLCLTKQETLSFSTMDSLQIQIGIEFTDNTVGASYIMETDVYPILKDGGLI